MHMQHTSVNNVDQNQHMQESYSRAPDFSQGKVTPTVIKQETSHMQVGPSPI